MLARNFAFNADQRATALLGIQAETEDAYEQYFPMLRKRERDHREILAIVYQAMLSDHPLTVERLYAVLEKELLLKNGAIELRLKDLKSEKLIKLERSESDRRRHEVLLTDDAIHRMQEVGEHIAAAVLHYAHLLKSRGPLPDQSPTGLFDPLQ